MYWCALQAVRGAVLELTVELIVASSTFIPNCLQVLIYSLLPPPGSPPLQPDQRGKAWSPPPLAVEVQEQVVNAVEQAVQLVPALPTRLLPMLVQNMPHKLRDRNTQCLYLRALLLLAEGKVGAPLREGLLAGIVEHLLSIDADIKWEEIVENPTVYDQEESGDEVDDIFELEGMSELDINGNYNPHCQDHQQLALQDGFHDPSYFATQQKQLSAAAANCATVDGDSRKRPPVDETADKLDSLMEMTFEHLQRRVNAGQLGAVWQTMLMAFERTLLHAYRCKFTQYLIFFLALKDPERCCSSFTACLLSHIRSPQQPPITRSGAAAFLASFLARCALAPKRLVLDVLQKLTAASQDYAANAKNSQAFARTISGSGSLVRLEASSGAAGGGSSNSMLAVVQRHQAFYAMVQALLYLLCYNMQPLLQPQQQQKAAGQQKQQSEQQQQQQMAATLTDLVRNRVLPLLSHQLAPLAVCHQAVTHEFVRQAQLLGLADETWEAAAVDAVTQHQAAVAAAAAASSAVVVGAGVTAADSQRCVLRPLEVFFPFDPYLLQRSSRFLELSTSYICFSNGQPHVTGAPAAAEAAAVGEDAVAGSSEEPESDADDELVGGSLERAQLVLNRACPASDDADDSDGSSSTTSEDPDHQQQPKEAGPSTAAAAAAGRSTNRQRSGLVPVGLAAAAGSGTGCGRILGPSPDVMATSVGVAPFIAGVSFSPSRHTTHLVGQIADTSLYGVSPMAMGQASPLMGSSPQPMSLTPYEGYMQHVPARLNNAAVK
eukprot:GHRR01029563.1.p1 GENE.GHRR01029563.1~~GHRR01029563.1.p1  ORF type:complete len:775 (+),score=300.41 GHRR01029563.1:409-2733(+)